MAGVSERAAFEIARALDVDLDDPRICQLCLSFVSMELERGNPRKIAGTTRRIARDLWADGLDEVLTEALERAVTNEIPGAAEAEADVKLNRASSRVTEAIVRTLAAELSRRAAAR